MLPKTTEEMLKFYNEGLNAYKQRKWDDAITAFNEALKILPGDGPSTLYLERSMAFKETPPPDDWDGVYVMTEK
ncbi:MAG: tetratricopeptide repeat protein [Leptospirales bacterium]|nr:tetratricopeptide repeat protein [Leptospirales bacterium]